MNEAIEKTVEAFRALLEEQLSRQERLEKGEAPKDYAALGTVTVGLIDGDGIGPVIMDCAGKVLEALLATEIAERKIVLKKIDGLTIENRIAKGKAVPDEVLSQIRTCDVLLKGPTATPHGGNMESANVALRRLLDLYANVRPVRIPEKKIDWTFFRENSEGEYVLGSRGIAPNDGMAIDFKVTTAAGSERIARAAFEFAKNNGKKSVTVVTKANIMKKTDGLFSEVARRVSEDYPEIEVRERYIDIMTAELIDGAVNATFDVFLLPNLYGDILTDEAAQLQGGVGTAGSANIGARCAMFEAIHGTAPRLIEAGLGAYASPFSILRAAVLMLRHISLAKAASRLESEVDALAAAYPNSGSADGPRCAEITDMLTEALKN